MERYSEESIVNLGAGKDIPIAELATLIADIVGYRGPVHWDSTKPDGTPRKLLDIGKVNALGWAPRILLREGIGSTYQWYRSERWSWPT